VSDIQLEKIGWSDGDFACQIKDSSFSRKKDAIVELLEGFPLIDKSSDKQGQRKALVALMPDRKGRINKET
jgi:hypothetical protein